MMKDFWTYLPLTQEYGRNFSVANLVDIKKFLKREPEYRMLSEAYLGRFDLVSYDFYKTSAYWWIIMAVNDITDPYDEGLVGKVIMFPNILDIQDFLYTMRMKKERW